MSSLGDMVAHFAGSVPVAESRPEPVKALKDRAEHKGGVLPAQALKSARGMFGAAAALDWVPGRCWVGLISGGQFFPRGTGATWAAAVRAAEVERYGAAGA